MIGVLGWTIKWFWNWIMIKIYCRLIKLVMFRHVTRQTQVRQQPVSLMWLVWSIHPHPVASSQVCLSCSQEKKVGGTGALSNDSDGQYESHLGLSSQTEDIVDKYDYTSWFLWNIWIATRNRLSRSAWWQFVPSRTGNSDHTESMKRQACVGPNLHTHCLQFEGHVYL